VIFVVDIKIDYIDSNDRIMVLILRC